MPADASERDLRVKLTLELVNGVEGQCLYLDDQRIAGPKPWGGGKVIRTWLVDLRDLKEIVRRAERGAK